jgi:phosphoenolpyruvate carboxylase
MHRHEQDFLMRQIQYLTQLLQQIIFKKNQNQHQEAVKEIQNALTKLTKDHPKNFQQLTFEETLALFTKDDTFEPELAIAVADLLVEQGDMLYEESFKRSQKSMGQALILYKRSLQDPQASVPLDIEDKINHLKKSVLANHLKQINNILN